jgi:hypothetical protein
VIATLTSGKAADALPGFLNQRSHHLKLEREELLSGQRQLEQALAPPANQHLFNVATFRCQISGLPANRSGCSRGGITASLAAAGAKSGMERRGRARGAVLPAAEPKILTETG